MISNFIPIVWSDALLQEFFAKQVIGNTVNRQYEGEARRGNTVKITTIGTPTIIDYATGTNGWRTADPEWLEDSAQDLLINQEKAFSFYVDDIDKRQSAGQIESVVSDAAAAKAEDADTYLSTLLMTGATLVDGSGSAARTIASGNDAFDMIRDMRTHLSAKKIPHANRFLLVNPEFSSFLLGADSKLTDVDTSGDATALLNAVLGKLLGFFIVETPLLSPGIPAAIGYHKSAMGFVHQVEEVEAVRATDRFADILRGLSVYGAKVVRPDAVEFWQEGAGV